MTPLERDLVRWESGDLTLEEVEAAHPEVGIRELVRVHTRLAMLRAIPMPDVERAWTMTVSKLEDRRPALSERFRGWARKPLIASFASVVMSGGVAYAAGVDPVERAVDGAWAGLTRVVTRESREADVAADEEAGSTEVTTSETAPVVTSTEPPGDDADGEHGKSKTKGNSEDHRKDEANRHRGWVNKKDRDKGKEGKDKPETPATGAEPPGHAEGSGPSEPVGSADKDKDKDKPSVHTEAADDSGEEAAPVEPPAPPAPPANSNAGGNGKGKDKLRL